MAELRRCALLLSLLCALSGRVEAQIRVMTPPELVRLFAETAGRIEGSTATFGAPFYGDRVLGQLVYGESKNHNNHCDKDDYSIPDPAEFGQTAGSSHEDARRLINIVLVRRGKCSFTQKVKVAYDKGAHAVIIIDREDSPLTARDMQNIIVADDGFGGNIHIPSVLISKEDGNKLLRKMEDGGKAQVIVELAWDLPTNHVVNTDLWMSSASFESNKFLKEFSSKRRTLNRVVVFQPHYAVFGLDHATSSMHNELCMDDSGEFCAEDPDGNGPITGKEVLNEDVRQLCIHMIHKVQRTSDEDLRRGHPGVEYAAYFWDYIQKFSDFCPLTAKNSQDRFGPECSTRLMHKVGIDVDKVQECVRVNKTKYLEKERMNQAWSPRALRINGWRYSGILDADLVTRAICSGFITQPHECTEIIKPRDPFRPYFDQTGGGVTFGQMAFWLMAISLALFAGLLLYKRYLKKEMRTTLREEVMLEVQAQMGEYQRMSQGV